MPKLEPDNRKVFQALSDPTRFAVVEKLSKGPAKVTDLAAEFEMALPSFTQHLRVLETCGVVRSEKLGRIRTFYLVPKRLRAAQEWLRKQRKSWDKRRAR